MNKGKTPPTKRQNITVGNVLGMIAVGYSIDRILEAYLKLTREMIPADFVSQLIRTAVYFSYPSSHTKLHSKDVADYLRIHYSIKQVLAL